MLSARHIKEYMISLELRITCYHVRLHDIIRAKDYMLHYMILHDEHDKMLKHVRECRYMTCIHAPGQWEVT